MNKQILAMQKSNMTGSIAKTGLAEYIHRNMTSLYTTGHAQEMDAFAPIRSQSTKLYRTASNINQQQELARLLGQAHGNQYVRRNILPIRSSMSGEQKLAYPATHHSSLLQRKPAGMTDARYPMSVVAPEPQKNPFQSSQSTAGMSSSEAPMSIAAPFNPSSNVSFSETFALGRHAIDLLFVELNAEVSAESSGSFSATAKQNESNPQISLDVREKKAEMEQEFKAGLNTMKLRWDGISPKLSFMNKLFPLQISPEGSKIHFSASPPIKSKFKMRNWEFEGDLSFKLTFDFGGQVRPEWIAAAVVVFNGVKQAAMIGSMMARIAAQVAGRFATVPIFIMPSELPAPFGNTNGNTTA